MDDFQLNLLITADNKSQAAFDAAKKQADDLAKQQVDISAKIAATQTTLANGQIKVNTSAAIYLGLQKELSRLTKEHTEAVKQQEQALTTLEKANARLASAQHQMSVSQERSMAQGTTSLMNYIKGFAGVAGVIQIVKTSIETNAEFERGMTRIREQSNTVGHGLEGLREQFHALAQATGKDATELQKSFLAFHDAIGGKGDSGLTQTMKLFTQISDAADVAGVSFETLGKAAVEAMKVMHVPMTEIEGVLETWVNTIPSSMMQQWNQASTGIIGSLKDIGATGTDAAKQAGTAFGNVAAALGDAGRAGNLLQGVLDKSTDTSTAFGRQMVDYVQNMGSSALESGKFLDESYEKLKANGVYQEHLASRDMARKVFARGWSQQQLRDLEESVLAERKIQEEHKRTGESVDSLRAKHARQQADAKGGIDALVHSANELYEQIGKTFGGGPVEAFTAILRSTTHELKMIADLVDKIDKFMRKGSTPPLVDETGDRTIDPKTNKPEMPQGFGTRRTGRYLGQGQIAGPDRGGAPPKMALGGAFEVEGKGGIDQQPVGFMATPGERVQVTTPTQESLQQQQDKADNAMREHFARFHGNAFTKTTPAAWWPQGGVRAPGAGGGGGGGSAGGGIPGGSTGGAGPTTASPGSAGADGKVSPEAATSTAPAGTTPATLPGSVASLGYEPGKFTPVQDLTTASGTSGGAGGGGGLAADRAKFAAELAANPALREKVLAIANNEQGGNAQGMQATIESMMNRASYQGRTLAQEAHWVSEKGYYADGRKASGMNRPMTEAALTGALGGSNVSNYGSDNASGAWGKNRIARDLYRQTNFINGEYFSSPGQNAAGPGMGNFNKYQAWLARMKAGDAAAPAASKDSAVKTATLTPNNNAALPGGLFDPNVTKMPVGTAAGEPNAVYPGDNQGSGRGSGGRFNAPTGAAMSGEKETVLLSNGQKVTVNKAAAPQFKGFFNDLISAGAPVKNLGGYGLRGGNPSQHPPGMAVDWAQHSRNVVDKDVQEWLNKNPKVLATLEKRWGMSGGQHWSSPDTGHWSVDNLYGAAHIAAAQAASKGTGDPATNIKVATVKATTGAVDPGLLAPTAHNKPAAAPTNTKVATAAPAVGQKTDDGGPMAAGKNLGGGGPKAAGKNLGGGGDLSGGAKAAGKNLGGGTKVAAATVPHPVSPQADPIPARQWGGDVRAGRQYMVGESGPETFTPSNPGSISPGGMDIGGMMGEYSKFADMMRAPIIPNLQMPRAGPIRQRMGRHVEAQRERDVGRMTRHASHSDIGFA